MKEHYRRKRGVPTDGEVGRANPLNNLFSRFYHPAPFTPPNTTTPTSTLLKAVSSTKGHLLSSPRLTPLTSFTAAQVRGQFRRLQPRTVGVEEGFPNVEHILHHPSPKEATSSWSKQLPGGRSDIPCDEDHGLAAALSPEATDPSHCWPSVVCLPGTTGVGFNLVRKRGCVVGTELANLTSSGRVTDTELAPVHQRQSKPFTAHCHFLAKEQL